MAFAVADRVRETTTTTGTGTLNLDGAVSGFRTFVSGIGDGNVTYYAIVHRTSAEFEIGIGTVTDASTDTLSRTTVLSSSNSNSAVTFSAGTKDVFCTQPASKAVFEDNNADVTLPDDLILGSDSAVLKFGADSDTTLTHTDGTGLTLNSTNKLTFGDAASFVQQSSNGVLRIDGEATIDLNASTAVTVSNDLKLDSDSAVLGFGADNEITLTHAADTGLTLNGTFAATSVTANSGVVVDNITIDGTEIDLSSGDLTLDVAGDIILDADGANVTVKDGGTTTLDIVSNGTTDVTLDAPGDIILDADGGDVFFKDGGTTFGSATNTSGNLIIKSGTTTALTFSGADVTIAGDLTISGDDLTMGTNTAGHLLIADGTNFNPVAVGSLSEISTVANDDVFLAVDTSGGGLKKITRSTIVSGLAASGASLSNVVEDTTPQLGGDLDAQGNNITSGGNIELETNKTLTFKTTVSGNDQGIGSIVASNGTNDFNKVSFKTGPDDYANNGEVNWATRVNGTLTSIFEINGSSLAKSGMVINPDSNAGIDFQIKGANDGLLVFVDSGLDKVGIGKIPANGILDVDGDVYATNFQGNLTGNVGNFNLASSVIDTTDSSGITVTPAVTMSSDLTVENNLVVDNNIQATSADISGNVAVGSNLTVTGTTTTNGIAVFEQGVIEGFSSLASATGTVVHNCANGHIFRHTGISADFTANFTNLGITDDHGTMVSLILVQGGTAYIPTAVQIDGAAQTILWQGGSAPSGTDSGTDIVSFSITQSAGTRTVLGQLTSYS